MPFRREPRACAETVVAPKANCPADFDVRKVSSQDEALRAFTVLTTRRYRQIVDRFEELARASLGKPRNIPDICAALAIGQRTLARAVRAVRGTTPSRHLHDLALAEARAALQDPATRSVGQVALRCGFRELGRFAAEYRAAFGENPSETLRRSSTARLGADVSAATSSANH
jgi:transcriptional regulator GlxA family with amidase domain